MTLLEKFKALKKWQKAAIIIIALVIFGQIVGKEETPSAPAAVLTQPQKDSIALQQRLNSGMYQAEVNLRREIKGRLNDPKSFDVLDSKAWTTGDSTIIIMIEYTAKNGFGGVVKSSAQAEADIKGNIVKVFGLQ